MHEQSSLSLASALPRMTSIECLVACSDQACFSTKRQSNAHINEPVRPGNGADAARGDGVMHTRPLSLHDPSDDRALKRARLDDVHDSDHATKAIAKIFDELYRHVRDCLATRALADSLNRKQSFKIALAHPLATFPQEKGG